MDHIRLPKDPILPLIRVPKACADHEIYDGNGFGDHLVDSGLFPDELSDEPPEMLYDHFKKSGYTVQYLEGFFQGWIFFGLLYELLSPFNLFARSDYIDVDDTTAVETLHTRGLRQTLLAWRAAYRNASLDEGSVIAERVWVCLYMADWFFSAIFAGDDYRDFSHDISLSLEVLFETITEEFRNDMSELPSWRISRSIDGRARDVMLRNGWCPSEIKRAERESVASASTRVFFQHMRMPDLGTDHSRCSMDGCRMLQINMGIYRPRHVFADCNCSMMGPKLEQVMCSLEDGDFPVLDVADDGEGNIALNTVSSTALAADEGYVAMSHVWADGLGNPSAIALPQCQIQRLAGLVKRVASQDLVVGVAQETPFRKLYLWCDTLLCPTEPHGKILAMSKLQEVYERATYVLAIDQSLESYAYRDIGSTELGMRLQLSRWSQRLWTYQEAQLATNLLIQLADVAVGFELLYRELITTDTAVDPGAFTLATTLRMMIHLRPPGTGLQDVKLPFLIVDRGIAYRSVSVPTDEPICLATALGLDTAIVTRAKLDQRWETFWNLVAESDAGISDGIIFHRRPRLRTRGYRWAPGTLSQSLRQMFQSTTAVKSNGLGKLTIDGLEVTFPGWRFRRKQSLPALMAEFFVTDRDIENDNLYIEYPDGRWFWLGDVEQGPDELKHLPLEDQDDNWYLILSEDNWEDPDIHRVNGLLTKLRESDDDHRCYASTVLKSVYSIPEAWVHALNLAKMHGDMLRESWEFNTGQLLLAAWRVLEDVNPATDGQSRFPSDPLHMTSNTRKCLQICFARVRTRYLQHIGRLGKDVPSFAGAIAYMGGEKLPDNLDLAIAKLLLSGYGVVEEVYDSSSMWCVD